MHADRYAAAGVVLLNSELVDLGSLQRYLAERPFQAVRATDTDLHRLQRFQNELRAVFRASSTGDQRGVVDRLNELSLRHPVRPQISGHDASSWHLHVVEREVSVAETLITEALFGMLVVVTERGADRLGLCGAPCCDAAFLDLSKTRSRRYCSARCATRVHVAALRARRRAAAAAAASGDALAEMQ
ncbi:MAG: CGNR zinc finger domain-containing protein [Acidimicrobiales bacterium]